LGCIIYVQTVQGRGQDGALRYSCLTISGGGGGLDCSPGTKTRNFLGERNVGLSLTKLSEECNSDSLYSKPGCHVVSCFFDIYENRGRGHVVVEVQGHVVSRMH
jgi:hypothetical protein